MGDHINVARTERGSRLLPDGKEIGLLFQTYFDIYRKYGLDKVLQALNS